MKKRILNYLLLLPLLIFSLYSCSAEGKLPEYKETSYPFLKNGGYSSEYPFNLNVVYFVPSDAKVNDAYEERLSEILLSSQSFVEKWMEQWGYGKKSFGLETNDKGLVKIILVKAKNPKNEYPYKGGGQIMKKEIEAQLKQRGIKPSSRHFLVIAAANVDLGNDPDAKVGYPFYGQGTWCYALDYEGLSQGDLGKPGRVGEQATKWIGGMFHELGHGMNLPHVGSTLSQKEDSAQGTTLMGPGNYSYGRRPTFFHPASAAILDKCQITSKVDKVFYTKTNATINTTVMSQEGDEILVKGSYTTDNPVTDVIIRHYNAEEKFLGGSDGYTSVAFVAKPDVQENSFSLKVPIKELTIQKFNYKLGITLVHENGNRTSKSLDELVYRVENNKLEFVEEDPKQASSTRLRSRSYSASEADEHETSDCKICLEYKSLMTE